MFKLRFTILFAISVALVVSNEARAGGSAGGSNDTGKLVASTDWEGQIEYLNELVAQGKLRYGTSSNEDPDSLYLAEPRDQFLFNGDLINRGPHSFYLTALLLEFKLRENSHGNNSVHIILGNRDGNNLALLHGLTSFDWNSQEFLTWVKSKRPEVKSEELKSEDLKRAHPDLALDYWLSMNGAPRGLEFAVKELEDPRRVEVLVQLLQHIQSHLSSENHRQTIEEGIQILHREKDSKKRAFDFYAAMLRPGGIFFETVRQASISHRHKNILFVHGGLTRQAYNQIFDGSGRAKTLSAFSAKTSLLKAKALVELEESPGRLTQLASNLIRYTRAVGTIGHYTYNDFSPIYGMRSFEEGYFRLPQTDVILALLEEGIDTLVTGHDPVGFDILPLTLDLKTMAQHDKRFEKYVSAGVTEFRLIKMDVSYDPQRGSKAIFEVDSEGTIDIRGVTSDGRPTFLKVPRENYDNTSMSFFGKVIVRSDGKYVITGMLQTNGNEIPPDFKSRQFTAYTYDMHNIHEIKEIIISGSELIHASKEGKIEEPIAKSNPIRAAQIKMISEEFQSHRKAGEKQGKRIFGLQAEQMKLLEEHYLGRVAVGMAGAAALSLADGLQSSVEPVMKEFIDSLNAESVFLVTGGIDNGRIEVHAHRLAHARSIPIHGFVHPDGLPKGMVNYPDTISIENEMADETLYENMRNKLDFIHSLNGVMIFWGGGGIVDFGISYALKKGIKCALFKPPAESVYYDHAHNVTHYQSARWLVEPGLASRIQNHTFSSAQELKKLIEGFSDGVFVNAPPFRGKGNCGQELGF